MYRPGKAAYGNSVSRVRIPLLPPEFRKPDRCKTVGLLLCFALLQQRFRPLRHRYLGDPGSHWASGFAVFRAVGRMLEPSTVLCSSRPFSFLKQMPPVKSVACRLQRSCSLSSFVSAPTKAKRSGLIVLRDFSSDGAASSAQTAVSSCRFDIFLKQFCQNAENCVYFAPSAVFEKPNKSSPRPASR